MNFNNTTTVAEADEDQAYSENWEFVIEEILYTIAASLCIGGIVLLHTYFKKLHWILKTLLTILCVHNTIVYLSLAVINAVMWFNGTGEITCGLSNVLKKGTFFITFEHAALVSFVRYHLASKTAANEEINLEIIGAMTIALYVFEYTANIVLVVASTTSYEAACLQDDSLEVNPMIGIGTVIIAVVITCGGLVYDYKLAMFLKQRNKLSKNGPMGTRLIPWKSSSEEYTLDIPLKASLASLVAGIILSLIIILILPSTSGIFTFHVIVTVFPSVVLGTLLGLTYRVRRLKKALPAIPRRLHYHEDDEEEETEEANNVFHVQVDQGLFHRGQMELNQFVRCDRHSVAGDVITEQLKKVNQKLDQQRLDNEDQRLKVIIVKPRNWNGRVNDLDIMDQVKEKLQFDNLDQPHQRNKIGVKVEMHHEPSQDDLEQELQDEIQVLDVEEPMEEPSVDKLIQEEMEHFEKKENVNPMAKVEEMIEEEMDHFNINRDFPKPLALSDDESDEIILNAAKLLRESVINEIKYPSASDSFDSEFQDFFEVLNEGN